MKSSCPICGSENLAEISVEKIGYLTLAQPFKYFSNQHKCQNCGEVGNFDGLLEDGYKSAREKAEVDQAAQLIELLESKGYSLQDLERSYELPFRTLSRWKMGKCSAGGLALLRVAAALPFVTSIAEQRFSPQAIVKECGGYLINFISASSNPSWMSTSGVATFLATGTFSTQTSTTVSAGSFKGLNFPASTEASTTKTKRYGT